MRIANRYSVCVLLLVTGAARSVAQDGQAPCDSLARALRTSFQLVVDIGNRPATVIGSTEGEPQYTLYDVRAVRRLGNGQIVIGNGGTGEIRFYTADGTFLRATGRIGPGPEECQNLVDVLTFARDTLLAYNGYPPRVALVSATGSFLNSIAVRTPDGARLLFERALGRIGDRILLLGYSPPADSSNRGNVGIYRPQMHVYAFSLDGSQSQRVLTIEGPEIGYQAANRGFTQIHVPFRRWTSVSVSPHGILVGDNASTRITLQPLSGPAVGVNVPLVKRPLTRAAVREYVAAYLRERPRTTPAQRRSWEDALAKLPLPDAEPMFSRVLMDARGLIWVQLYQRPDDSRVLFLVHDPGQNRTGCAVLPPGLSASPDAPVANDLLEVGRDYILGVWKDDLGIETVRQYPLRVTNR